MNKFEPPMMRVGRGIYESVPRRSPEGVPLWTSPCLHNKERKILAATLMAARGLPTPKAEEAILHPHKIPRVEKVLVFVASSKTFVCVGSVGCSYTSKRMRIPFAEWPAGRASFAEMKARRLPKNRLPLPKNLDILVSDLPYIVVPFRTEHRMGIVMAYNLSDDISGLALPHIKKLVDETCRRINSRIKPSDMEKHRI